MSEKIRLTLVSVLNSVPTDNRLRRLLRIILRGYAFKVVRVEDVPDEHPLAPANAGKVRR
jgi:hypothetical protein